MEQKLQILGLKPLANFRCDYICLYLCSYQGINIFISNMLKDGKVLELEKLKHPYTIFDTTILENLKAAEEEEGLDLILMTKHGICVKEENYLFVNYSPNISGDFEICISVDIDDLPENILNTKNRILIEMYKNGYYKGLEKINEEFDIFIPTNHGEIDDEVLLSHIKHRYQDKTLTGRDTRRVNVLDQIEFRNIRLLFIDNELEHGGYSVRKGRKNITISSGGRSAIMEFPDDIFAIENIPDINKRGWKIKNRWDSYYHHYNNDVKEILEKLKL